MTAIPLSAERIRRVNPAPRGAETNRQNYPICAGRLPIFEGTFAAGALEWPKVHGDFERLTHSRRETLLLSEVPYRQLVGQPGLNEFGRGVSEIEPSAVPDLALYQFARGFMGREGSREDVGINTLICRARIRDFLFEGAVVCNGMPREDATDALFRELKAQ